jgi:hypothetical protein
MDRPVAEIAEQNIVAERIKLSLVCATPQGAFNTRLETKRRTNVPSKSKMSTIQFPDPENGSRLAGSCKA